MSGELLKTYGYHPGHQQWFELVMVNGRVIGWRPVRREDIDDLTSFRITFPHTARVT